MDSQNEYMFIKGHRGAELLYVPSEKCLYVKKNERNGKQYYICYQTILSKERKIKKGIADNIDCSKCTARVFLNKRKQCWRNKIAHTLHKDHQVIVEDLRSLDAMKRDCKMLKRNLAIPSASRKVNAREIYDKHMSK